MPEKVGQALEPLFWVCIAGFGYLGGVARYLHEVSQNRRRFSWGRLFICGTVSGFCGILPALLVAHFVSDVYLIGFAAGMGGGIGWGTVDILLWYIRVKLGVPKAATEGSEAPHETD
jgi:hypothetical protein